MWQGERKSITGAEQSSSSSGVGYGGGFLHPYIPAPHHKTPLSCLCSVLFPHLAQHLLVSVSGGMWHLLDGAGLWLRYFLGVNVLYGAFMTPRALNTCPVHTPCLHSLSI